MKKYIEDYKYKSVFIKWDNEEDLLNMAKLLDTNGYKVWENALKIRSSEEKYINLSNDCWETRIHEGYEIINAKYFLRNYPNVFIGIALKTNN